MEIGFWGVDYGSKLAGTTAIAEYKNGKITLFQSTKGRDADAFLLERFNISTPSHIFIDAPLSLPKVYTKQKPNVKDDFFYRGADRELQCMSPLFLGGLTARAIRLKTQLEVKNGKVFETYPSALSKIINLDLTLYKKDPSYLGKATDILSKISGLELPSPLNYHAFDALLALYSGWRFLKNTAEIYGNSDEGLIVV